MDRTGAPRPAERDLAGARLLSRALPAELERRGIPWSDQVEERWTEHRWTSTRWDW